MAGASLRSMIARACYVFVCVCRYEKSCTMVAWLAHLFHPRAYHGGRKAERKGGAFTQSGLDLHVATQASRESAGDREAQPSATKSTGRRAVYLSEFVEDQHLILLVDTDPRVGDFPDHIHAPGAARFIFGFLDAKS